MVQEAEASGLTTVGATTLRKLVTGFKDAFMIKLGNFPPADFDPLGLKHKPDAVPYVAKRRQYTTDQLQILKWYIGKVKEYSFISPKREAT